MASVHLAVAGDGNDTKAPAQFLHLLVMFRNHDRRASGLKAQDSTKLALGLKLDGMYRVGTKVFLWSQKRKRVGVPEFLPRPDDILNVVFAVNFGLDVLG